MSKIILEYNEQTGQMIDAKGLFVGIQMNITGFEPDEKLPPVLELIKQGVSAAEIIKLKNADLL